MESKGVVEIPHDRVRYASDPIANSFDCDRSNLLRLRLGIAIETCLRGWEQDLEWIDPGHVRGHWNDGDDAAPQSPCSRVRGVVADHDSRPPLVRLGSSDRVEIYEMDASSPDHDPIPSPDVGSQLWASPAATHSSQADL